MSITQTVIQINPSKNEFVCLQKLNKNLVALNMIQQFLSNIHSVPGLQRVS